MSCVPFARIGALCVLLLCGLPVGCRDGGCTTSESSARPAQPNAIEAVVADRGAALLPSPDAPPLPAVQRARLEYLYDAGALLGRAWPRLARKVPCVLLVDSAAQWLVGCEQPSSPGFVSLGEALRGRPVFARASDRLAVARLDLTTQQWLARAAATAHVEPSDPKATGQPDAGLVLVATLEALRGARHDFRECMTEEWVSVALHEMMHVWQLGTPAFASELRAIHDGTLVPDAIRALFVRDARYRAQVEREYALLVAAASDASDETSARLALQRWRALYRKRIAGLARRPGGQQLVRADRVFTQLEGVARYVESRFLVEPKLRPNRPVRGDAAYRDFERYAKGGYAAMQNRQLDAEYDYAIGFHLALLLDRADPTWQDRVHADPGALIAAVETLDTRD